jgi:hypothetical protein
VVLRAEGDGDWRVVGEVSRRPGLAAGQARAQAVLEVTGNNPGVGATYAVVLRSEWMVAQRL